MKADAGEETATASDAESIAASDSDHQLSEVR